MISNDTKVNLLAANNAGSDGGYVDMVMWVGDPSDPTKGNIIDNSMIDAFTITENMFTLLPTMVFQIITKGRFYHYDNIKIGDIINVTLTPKKLSEDDEDPEPYLKGSFLVQTITNDPMQGAGVYLNKYICIYVAQRYLSEIAPYPSMNLSTALLYLKTTSTEALTSVLGECGLRLQDDTDSGEIDDRSYWLNCNETRAMFANRIVEHAWAGRGNSPLLYTDIFGNTHYKTIKDICKSEKDKGVMDVKYIFMKNLNHTTNNPNNKENVVLMSDIHAINAAGPILNKGGYSLNYAIYNPYNLDKIPHKQNAIGNIEGVTDESIPVYKTANVASVLSNQDDDGRSDGYRSVHIAFKENLLATIPNRQPSEKDVVTLNSNGGIHFDELHPNYDLAPIHNEQVRRNFFQQFVKIIVDGNRQLKCFNNVSNRPRIGETIYVDTSSQDTPDVVYTGRYCIVEVKYAFGYKKPYTLEITVANDGYYGDQHE